MKKQQRTRRDPADEERYAIILRETAGPGLDRRLGYERVILRNLTAREAAEIVKKFKR